MVITFPHMGNMHITAKALLDDLGVEYRIPPYNNNKALELGTRYTPESACLPLKMNVGNLIQAHGLGADTVLMAGGKGPCRFGYYCEMLREILNDAGYKMKIITLETPYGNIKEFYRRYAAVTKGAGLFKVMHSLLNSVRVSILVDELEKLGFNKRPVEAKKGSTDKLYNEFMEDVYKARGSKAIINLIKKFKHDISQIKENINRHPLKIGIVGEIYTIIDPYINFNIQEKLGRMGVKVDRIINISGWIIEHMIKKGLGLPRDLRYAEAAKPYLETMIGGHAQETAGNTVIYAKNGYDGVIQIYPLTCMPEIVAQAILPSVSYENDIPVLTLIIDEMTSDTGYMTRIEAFLELLARRREKLSEKKISVLYGY